MTDRHTTNPKRRRSLAVLALAAAALAAPSTAGAAELFYATTPANQIVSFTAQAPGRMLERESLLGMASGESIVGLDQRPATGQLYALTSAGRLLVINPATGSTKQIGSPVTLTGTQFGFDFDPTADRIRVVSDADQNLRLHPDTGALVATDGPLAYLGTDAGAGANPAVGAAAYTSSVFGDPAPATTTLLDIDSGRNVVVRQDPPNNGTLVTVGALGVDAGAAAHFDIGSGDRGWAAFAATGQDGVRLWSVNLSTGATTAAATHPRIGVDAITAMAATGDVSSDQTSPKVAIGNYTVYRSIWLDRGLNFTLSCAEDCTSDVTLRLGRTVLGSVTVELAGAGTKVARIPLTATGRTAAAASGRIAATITFQTEDLAGNDSTQVTSFPSIG